MPSSFPANILVPARESGALCVDRKDGKEQHFDIGAGKHQAFWDVFCDQDVTERTDYGIRETVDEKSYPVAIEVNFPFLVDEKFDENIDLDRITKRLVFIFTRTVLDFFHIDIEDNEAIMVCSVCRRSDKVEGKVIISSFTMTLINLKTRLYTLRDFLNYFTETAMKNNAAQSLQYSIDAIFSQCFSVPNKFYLVGCGPNPVTSVSFYEYNSDIVAFDELKELVEENLNIEHTHIDLLDHAHVIGSQLDPSFTEDKLDGYYIPFILSTNFGKNLIMAKNVGGASKPREKETISSPYVKEDGEHLEKVYLSLIDKSGYVAGKNPSELIMIGKALATIHDQDEKGFAAWMKFCPVEDEKNKDKYHELWESFKERRVTSRTLAFIARRDNFVKYDEWMKGQVFFKSTGELGDLVADALYAAHTDVAKLFYRIYGLDYVCVNEGRGVKWYGYKNLLDARKSAHRWSDFGDGLFIKKMVAEDFCRHIINIRYQLTTKQQAAQGTGNGGKSVTAQLDEYIKQCGVLISKLKNNGYLTQILKTLQLYFLDPGFSSYLGNSKGIVGVENGVFDVDHRRRVYYRYGLPEDYVIKFMPTKYKTDFNEKSKKVIEVMEWFNKVYPDTELRDFVFRYFSSGLLSGNIDKIFAIFTGCGDNSKSMIIKLMECVFGQKYLIKFPVAQLTSRSKNASGPSPQLARAKGALWSCVEETDQKQDKISGGLIKSLASTDSYYARNNFENGEDCEKTDKIILVCNDIPELTSCEPAVQNRVRIVPHLSKFNDSAPDSLAEQLKDRHFKRDPNFDKKIPDMAEAMLWLLVKYFTDYVSMGLKQPKIVTEVTNKFWITRDLYRKFVSEKLIKTDSPNNVLKITEVFSKYNDWYRSNYPGNVCPGRNELEKEFASRMGKFNDNNKWVGWKIVNEDDDGEGRDFHKKGKQSDEKSKSWK